MPLCNEFGIVADWVPPSEYARLIPPVHDDQSSDDDDDGEGFLLVHRSLIERGGSLTVALPKNNRVRLVTLPNLLVEDLRAHMARVQDGGDALLFVGERGATPRRGNWREIVGWRSAVAAAGLPEGFHFHDLRHTGNHLVARSGASTPSPTASSGGGLCR